MELWVHLPTAFWCLWIFVLGLMVGSFLNVLVARLPYEKSVIWPSSRCFTCYRKVRFTDNLPLIGYLRLRGKCRFCGTSYSARYLWVELGTGLAFLGLFLFHVVFNVYKLPGVTYDPLGPDAALPPLRGLAVFGYHAVLIAALIAASVIDAEHRIIPPQITYTALAVGVIGGALMPWPWPYPANVGTVTPAGVPWILEEFLGKIPAALQPWPFWGPTFNFAPPGSWKLGLLNSVLGALAGSLVVRVVKWLFEMGLGREALGLGDADLLMMAGAFFGWQIAVMALFVGSFAAIVLYVAALALPPPGPRPGVPTAVAVGGERQPRELPFGPGLAVGVVATWLAWPWFGPRVQFPFFDGTMMVALVVVMGVSLLAAALFMRKPAEPAPVAAK